jgi:hypothetical protein
MYMVGLDFLGLGHAFEEQEQGAPDGGYVNGFERGVQNQYRGLHRRWPHAAGADVMVPRFRWIQER